MVEKRLTLYWHISSSLNSIFLHSNVFTSYHHNITFIIVFGSASGYIYFICSFSLNYMQVSKTLLKNYGGLPKYCSVFLIHVLIPRYYDKVLILRKCFVYLLNYYFLHRFTVVRFELRNPVRLINHIVQLFYFVKWG